MANKYSSKVDTYIAKSQDFAQPILNKIRELVWQACPDVEETLKWGAPHFEYKGVICSMMSFKQHCNFSFWKGTAMKDPHKLLTIMGKTSFGLIQKLKDVEDLPEDKIMLQYLAEAISINESGVKVPLQTKTDKKELTIPDYFMNAVKTDKKALETFEGFSYSNKKEYVEWVTEAKREETREKRLVTSVEWLAEGKPKNWKYM